MALLILEPKSAALRVVEIAFHADDYKAIGWLKGRETIPERGRTFGEECSILGNLTDRVSRIRTEIRATRHDGLSRSLDLDHQVAIVGSAHKEVRFPGPVDTGSRPRLKSHGVDDLRVLF